MQDNLDCIFLLWGYFVPVKNDLLLSCITIILIVLLAGCESGHNKSVTGAFFNRSSGELKTISADFDSMTSLREQTGESSNIFAGKFRDANAFAVIKFPQPTGEFIDSLESAVITFNVSTAWSEGSAEFELYEAVSDWSDSVLIDPDMFVPVSSPIATFSDTPDSAGNIGLIDFQLTRDAIDNMRNWNGPGTYKISGSESCETMVGLTSVWSSYKPKIEYILRNEEGLLDTTSTDCILSNYYFDTGFEPDSYDSDFTAIVSNAGVQAFVVQLSLPDSLYKTDTINKCTMTLNIEERMIPQDDNFFIAIYQLTEPVAGFFDAQHESFTSIEQHIEETVESVEIDITSIVELWHKKDESNFGLLVKPISTNDSPSHIVCTLVDSVTIVYTTLPEVE